MTKPILFAALLGVIAIGYFALGERAGDLDSLRSALARLEAWRTANALMLAALFLAGYVVITALSLPLATVMTLGAGALFGFWQGLVVVPFASTIGATLAFLAARTLMRERVRARLCHRASAVDAGLARDGAFHLFTLRLIPIMPFFAGNLLMGLTPTQPHRFYLASQAGMLAGTAVYANASTRLAEADSLSGTLSPALLLSFALLDFFPWVARMFARYFGRRRAYARRTRPKTFDRNLIVIGAGAAGLVASYVGAATGAKVTVIEAQKMGGDCLNLGCVPSKALIASAKRAHQIGGSEAFGLEAKPARVRFDVVMEREHRVIAGTAPHDSVERYAGLGVEVLEGYAKILDPWTVEIARNDGGTTRLATRALIVATGARPFVPPLPGIDAVGHLTSDTLWEALRDREDVPRRMVVLGGGPIVSEPSQSFARLGAAVTQIEMVPRVMIREDEEVSELMKTSLEQDGVTVLTDHKAVACRVDAGEKWIEVARAGDRIAEYVLAMKHGLALGKILGTLHIYPTFAEANKYAAGVWRRANLNPRLLSFAKGFHRWRLG